MAVGSSLAGVLADALVARGMAVTTVRKSLQTVAFLVPAAALMLLSQPGITPQASACRFPFRFTDSHPHALPSVSVTWSLTPYTVSWMLQSY